MSGAISTATKIATDLKPGDRICYKSGDLLDSSSFSNAFVPLSSDILRIIDPADGKLEIMTVSGRLKVCEATRVFELVGSDYDTAASQLQYVVKPAETFMGVSIE
jgi:hypothetical protein